MRCWGYAWILLSVAMMLAPEAPAGVVPAVVSTEFTLDRAGNPWTVGSNVTVRQGGTLRVEAGAIVEFTGNWLLTAEGNTGGAIVVQGAPYDSAYFRPASGVSEWKGIYVSGGTGSSFDYGVVLNASKGLNLNTSNAPVTHCTFRRCTYGIWCRQSSPPITSCWVSEASWAGIFCEGVSATEPISRPVIFNCNLFDNALWNVYMHSYSWPGATTIDARGNWWGTAVDAEIRASIHDYEDDPTGCNATVLYDPWLSETPVEERTWGSIKALFRD